MNNYQRALEERKKQHLLRALPTPDADGTDFFSNDYLGLAQSSSFRLEIEKAIRKAPVQNGATGSRLLSGNSTYALEVEKEVATYHQAEDALIYASGYTANVGLISSLATRDITLVCDELIHASLIDGARLGHARRVRFKHNNPKDLESKLSKIQGEKAVIVESVYSMDGDVCPLKEVVDICEKHQALLIVDEAHAIAVMGEDGGGLTQHLGLESQVTARIMTYGKGPGIHGAAVVGPSWLKEYQVNFARSFIFSTAPAPHQFASISALYSHLPKCDVKRNKLRQLVDYFIQCRDKSEGQWLASPSHIQSLIAPGNEQVIRLAEKLKEAGIQALPIRTPSVPEGTERIRFCLHAYNTEGEIDLLFETLDRK